MPQTATEIDGLLQSIGREPNRKLGQHFMIDGNLVRKLADQAGAADAPVILEVGPGTGTLTETLLEAGLSVVAVEIDAHLAGLLDERLTPRHPGRFRLVCGDVLAGKHELNADLLAAIAELSGAGGETARPVRLIANLPYNIASPLIAELIGLAWRARGKTGRGDAETRGRGDRAVPVDRLAFTVQKEVADRLTAAPGGKDYGPLSVLCQGLGDVSEVVHRISPNAFHPKPNVHSAMLRIDLGAARLAAAPDLRSLHAWMEAGFGHRRKTLAASIRLADATWQVRLTTAAMACGVDLSRRGETLAVAEYLALAAAT
ncbi:MAG: Ribosomal RNA small subunit methyltransferase A [Phycisphaerae bacterium]|nr:Ribosomal RNA small subunit methyltransferase A [Phycisphaerae bacterium]